MSGRHSREKGANFERLVAKMVTDALGGARKDCYRTPMSGGHHSAAKGDLVVSPAFAQKFPFSVECKHHKDWRPGRFFVLTKSEEAWLAQAEEARTEQCAPLLVMRGHATPIFVALLCRDLPSDVDLRSLPRTAFVHRKIDYVLLLFRDLLAALSGRNKHVL